MQEALQHLFAASAYAKVFPSPFFTPPLHSLTLFMLFSLAFSRFLAFLVFRSVPFHCGGWYSLFVLVYVCVGVVCVRWRLQTKKRREVRTHAYARTSNINIALRYDTIYRRTKSASEDEARRQAVLPPPLALEIFMDCLCAFEPRFSSRRRASRHITLLINH